MVRKQKKGLTQIAHTAAVCEWLSGNVKVRPETCNVGRICESYGLNTAKPLQQKACDLDKLWGKFYQAIMLNQDKVSLYSSLPCCLGQLYLPYPSWNFSIIFSHELPVDIRNVQRPGWVQHIFLYRYAMWNDFKLMKVMKVKKCHREFECILPILLPFQ